MKNYRKLVLNTLLESYEKSLVFAEKNQRNQNIYFRIMKKTLPEYFDDASAIYDEIHLELKAMESAGLIRIHWRNNKEGHIADKVSLVLDHLAEAYSAAGRKPLRTELESFLDYLGRCEASGEAEPRNQDGEQECRDPGFREQERREHEFREQACREVRNFTIWLRARIEQGLSVKAYANISDLQDFDELIRGIRAVTENLEECFVRELSMKLYGDSKKLERLRRRIESVIVEFSSEKERFDNTEDVFAEFGVFKNPSLVMVKGNLSLLTTRDRIPLESLTDGIGIASRDLENIDFDKAASVDQIITIENLTAFYRVYEKNALVIYLGGFHNQARRNLILKAQMAYPGAKLLHWGDIDVGGFKIYLDLCAKTGLPFEPMHMGADVLEKYRRYTKQLTRNDESELDKLLNKFGRIEEALVVNDSLELPITPAIPIAAEIRVPGYAVSQIRETLLWMKKNRVKLEQEIVAALAKE